MLDVSNAFVNFSNYGGLACSKLGITLDGTDYMLKAPGNLKVKDVKNTKLSYSNSSVTEYLGSKIYEVFRIPVHEVQLVQYNGKICAMCKDFVKPNKLVEFRELISTYSVNGTFEIELFGTTTDLEEILDVMHNQHVLQQLPSYEDFFWKMFVVDALIGNHDRNNGNHGILQGKYLQIAPVYDNGGCLNPTWDDAKMQECLKYDSKMLDLAYRVNTCYFTKNNKAINPFQLLASKYYPGLNNALCEVMLTPFEAIKSVIDNCDILSDIQREFYTKLLKLRYAKLAEIAKDCYSLTIQRYIEVYGIDQSRISDEIHRLMSITGSKSLKELSEYIQDNFL